MWCSLRRFAKNLSGNNVNIQKIASTGSTMFTGALSDDSLLWQLEFDALLRNHKTYSAILCVCSKEKTPFLLLDRPSLCCKGQHT
eukprot:UN05807